MKNQQIARPRQDVSQTARRIAPSSIKGRSISATLIALEFVPKAAFSNLRQAIPYLSTPPPAPSPQCRRKCSTKYCKSCPYRNTGPETALLPGPSESMTSLPSALAGQRLYGSVTLRLPSPPTNVREKSLHRTAPFSPIVLLDCTACHSSCQSTPPAE